MVDLIVIGGGPAGMNAALYAKRMGLDTVIVEGLLYGGQMLNTLDIENYIGNKIIKGVDLSAEMEGHMREFLEDDKVLYDEVKSISRANDIFTVELSGGTITSKTIIIATGCQHRKLSIPGEEEFTGLGVSYCAVCDGPFFADKEVVVIGGGNSAIEEALYLSTIVKKVTVVHRRDELRASKIYVDKAFEKENIDFIWSHVPVEIIGKDKVDGVVLNSTKDEESCIIPADGVFIYVGVEPNIPNYEHIEHITSNSGFIMTNEDMSTPVAGLFAVGDVRDKELRQIITAASDGAIAAQSAYNYNLMN